MKKYVFIFCLGFFLLFSNSYNAMAQAPPTKYDESEKDVDEVKFAVKTNIMSIIAGELPASFEYKFIKFMGVEAGAGLILPYYVNLDLFSLMRRKMDEDFVPFTNKKLGYSLSFTLNIYPYADSWGGIFTSPYIHFRHYSTVNVLNCGLEGGYRGLFLNALLLEVGTRIYWKHRKSLDEAGTLFYPVKTMSLMNFDANIFIRIGYAF